MNRGLGDTGGGLLLVSQFTLAADTRSGMRPGFSTAAAPELAEPLFSRLVQTCRQKHSGGGNRAVRCPYGDQPGQRRPGHLSPAVLRPRPERVGLIYWNVPHPLSAVAQPMANERQPPSSDIKQLISKGLEQGYLTYAEVNDHLPDDLVDAEQIEDIIGMINGMGIEVHEVAPDAETLLLADGGTGNREVDDTAAEEAAAALTALDGEGGRTTDPVRMYMREMGTVELLTREGEIAIAKRIEEGLGQVQASLGLFPATDRLDPRGLRAAQGRQEAPGRDHRGLQRSPRRHAGTVGADRGRNRRRRCRGRRGRGSSGRRRDRRSRAPVRTRSRSPRAWSSSPATTRSSSRRTPSTVAAHKTRVQAARGHGRGVRHLQAAAAADRRAGAQPARRRRQDQGSRAPHPRPVHARGQDAAQGLHPRLGRQPDQSGMGGRAAQAQAEVVVGPARREGPASSPSRSRPSRSNSPRT